MAHCHPVMMVHSIHQAPLLHLAQHAHEPHAFVLLAFTQQHPNSQHLASKPGQLPAALILTKDHMFVGASMCPATQVATFVLAATAFTVGASAMHIFMPVGCFASLCSNV